MQRETDWVSREYQIVLGREYNQVVWEQFVIPWVSIKYAAKCVHFPSNSFALASLFLRPRLLVTIHDLMFLSSQGGTAKQRIGNLYRAICTRVFLRDRVLVSTVSEHSRGEIMSKLKKRAHLTENSCDYLLDSNLVESQTVPISAKPYFVHIGGLTSNKNTRRVLLAWRDSNLDDDFDLYVLGDSAESFRRYFHEIDRTKGLILPGLLDRESVTKIVKNSVAMILPSIQEGFGLPIVEAAYLGIPSITSNRPPMNQLVAGCVIEVNPDDSQSIANAIRELAFDTDLQNKLRAATNSAKLKFSREKLFESLRDWYESALTA